MTTQQANHPDVEFLDAADHRAEAVFHAVLSHDAGTPSVSSDQITQFLDTIAAQQLEITPIIQAKMGKRVLAQAIALRSPGRTGLIMLAAQNDSETDRNAATTTLRRLCDRAWQSDTMLMQVLLQPHDSIAQVVADAGFTYLAELVYLQRQAEQAPFPVPPTPTLEYLTFTKSAEPDFLAMLEHTYKDSLDCPGLNGLRNPRDVLIGHRHTGVFHEHLWMLALNDDQPVGILLLSEVPARSCLEIAYVGVSQKVRGRGIGNALVRKAIEVAWEEQKSHVTLAVDHTNTFACKLYARWQFTELARRRAWIISRPS